MKDDSAFSVVVLPEPVPPETITLSRVATAASRYIAISSEKAPKFTRSLMPSFSFLNLRIETSEPSTATGGTIALKREPSARRAST